MVCKVWCTKFSHHVRNLSNSAFFAMNLPKLNYHIEQRKFPPKLTPQVSNVCIDVLVCLIVCSTETTKENYNFCVVLKETMSVPSIPFAGRLSGKMPNYLEELHRRRKVGFVSCDFRSQHLFSSIRRNADQLWNRFEKRFWKMKFENWKRKEKSANVRLRFILEFLFSALSHWQLNWGISWQ